MISIIVPAYNVQNQVERCINSILNQTFQDFELIIVNDGSTDSTGEICNKYKNDPRVIIITQENQGVSAARNAALRIARGEYIAFVDSDDSVGRDYISQLVQYSDYDFVTAGYNWQDGEQNWHKMLYENKKADIEEIRKHPSLYLGKCYFGSPWATLMKKSIIEENNIRFNQEVRSGEDTIFIFQYLMHCHSVKILDYCDYSYFYYGNSLLHSAHRDLWKWKKTVEGTIDDFFEPDCEKEERTLLERRFDVMKNLLGYYNNYSQKEIQSEIFEDVFWKKSISFMNKYGNLENKILIHAMRKNKYSIYVRFFKIKRFTLRVINHYKRKISGCCKM